MHDVEREIHRLHRHRGRDSQPPDPIPCWTRRSSTLLIVVVVFVFGGLFAPLFGSVAGGSPLKAKSREYKLRLRATDFDSKEERENLWKVVAATAGDTPFADDSLDAKKCRRISFLDTPSRSIHSADRILRRREKLDDGQCGATKPGEVEITFKARGSEEAMRRVSAEPWAHAAKVEEDRLVGREASPAMVLSVSADSDAKREVSNVGDVRKLFPEALPELKSDVPLETACRIVFERRWELKSLGLHEGVKEPELALWHWPKNGGGPGDPWLAELSFSVALDDAKAVEAADRLEARLVRELSTKLEEPGSKTAAVYACREA